MAQARQREANPVSVAWAEARPLLDLARDEPTRLKLRELLRRMIESVVVLIVPRRSHRLAAAPARMARRVTRISVGVTTLSSRKGGPANSLLCRRLAVTRGGPLREWARAARNPIPVSAPRGRAVELAEGRFPRRASYGLEAFDPESMALIEHVEDGEFEPLGEDDEQ